MATTRWIGEPLKCGHPGCQAKQAQPRDGFCPTHLQRYFAPLGQKPTRPVPVAR